MHGCADFPASGVVWLQSLEHFDERRLTDSVFAYDAYFLTGGEHIGEVFQNGFVSEGFADVHRLENFGAYTRRARFKTYGFVVSYIARAFLKFVVCVNAVFGFSSAGLWLEAYPCVRHGGGYTCRSCLRP